MKLIPGLVLFAGGLFCLALADGDHHHHGRPDDHDHHHGHHKDEKKSEEISTSPLVTKLIKERSDNVPPPPPPPGSSRKFNDVEPEVDVLKPQESKRKFAQAKKAVVPPKQRAQRRDYGAAPKRQVIIKQAGPSKQYGWVGHGKFVPKYGVPNVFAGAYIPKWVHMGNNVFEAGLVYEAPSSSYSSGSHSVPYSGSEAASTSYNLPPPAPAKQTYKAPEKPTYKAPEKPKPKPVATYGPPKVQYPSPKPATNSYISSKPAPVYKTPEPTYKPPVPAYKSPEPAYKSPEPAYKSPVPAAPAPFYSAQNPFKTSNTYNVIATPAATTPATTTASYKPQAFSSQPNVFTAFSSEFTKYPLKPTQDYQAEASIQSPATSHPNLSRATNVYNIPVKVEETPGDGEVYYIFYEDDKTASNTQNQVPGYIEETKPPRGVPNLFNPPNDEDIRTIYVPFENAVNVPVDVDVASSFGYGGASSKKPSSGSGFPNFPASSSSPTYDNPISSYDAPIYNDDSYTAKNPITNALFREETKHIKHRGKPRAVRQSKRSKTLKVAKDSLGSDSSIVVGKVPFGSRLGPRKHYEILGL